MIRKVTASELRGLKKKGARVKRQLGTAEAKAPEPKPQKPEPEAVEHASMAASMEASAQQQAAANVLLARNSEIIKEFAKSLEKLAKPVKPIPYTFIVKRDEDKLLDRVFARPGIVE